MFARTLFLRIFVNSVPREFKILAKKESLIDKKTTFKLVREFKTSRKKLENEKLRNKSHEKVSKFTVNYCKQGYTIVLIFDQPRQF